MVTSSTNYFVSAKQLAINNKDQPTWQIFAQHSRALADAMKKIVTSLKYDFIDKMSIFEIMFSLIMKKNASDRDCYYSQIYKVLTNGFHWLSV